MLSQVWQGSSSAPRSKTSKYDINIIITFAGSTALVHILLFKKIKLKTFKKPLPFLNVIYYNNTLFCLDEMVFCSLNFNSTALWCC